MYLLIANGTETLAVPQDDGTYRLFGYKWFSSATRDLKHRQRNQTTTTNSNHVKTVRSVAKTARK